MSADQVFFDDVWTLLKEVDSLGQLLPGEKTVAMYAEETGLSEARASDRLRKHVKDGKLTRRPVGINGKRMYAYRPVKK